MASIAIVLLVAVLASQTLAVDEFRQADRTTKQRVLSNAGSAREGIEITEIIALVREGMRDVAPDVRRAALAAVAMRALLSRAAGTAGAGWTSSSPEARVVIPASWTNDRRMLMAALEAELLAALRTDAEPRVRHDALLAIGHLTVPDRDSEPFSEWFVDLLLERYREDSASSIRAEVLKTFRLGANDSAAIRRIVIDALVDRDPVVRTEAVRVLRPAEGSRITLQMNDVRSVIDRALIDGHEGARLGAVRALNELGSQAAAYVPLLDRLRRTDPDAQVRASAGLAIEAIQVALRQ